MAFYKTVKMKGSGHLKTTVCRMHTYELGHVKDLKSDMYKDEPHIQKPPKCYSAGQKLLVEMDDDIMEAWEHLCAEPKMFIHAVMHAVDILAEHFSSLDLKDVKRKRNKAFNKRWKEPEFRTTTVRDLQKKRNPDRIRTGLSTAKLLWNLKVLVHVKINCMQILQNITGRRYRSQAFQRSVDNCLKRP